MQISDLVKQYHQAISSGAGDADRDERCGKSCGLSAVSDKRKYFLRGRSLPLKMAA